MLHGIIMPGSIMRTVQIEQDDPANCQAACRAETQCAAWTYVRPGLQGQQARCWLKSKVPQQFQNQCCTSGVEHVAGSAGKSGLPGSIPK